MVTIVNGDVANDFGPKSMFSPKVYEAARMVAEGLRNVEIGKRLNISENAVKMRLMKAFDVTGMGTRLELALWYRAHFPEEFQS